ncbi:hypothetical protein HPP92_014507 [Vanilla planifolia]|uniref:Uncharacterized protein n=1 Tax=Vanilla planifolia TaxID=51239 RepID=A0A835UWY4_VANPL|nr:hypothetical protein HPP92_014507 [Vanilla planifolia]
MTSAPPLMNLDTLWTTTSAPRRAGDTTIGMKVLSTTSITLPSPPRSSPGMSATASVRFADGLNVDHRVSPSLTAARTASASLASTKVVRTPQPAEEAKGELGCLQTQREADGTRRGRVGREQQRWPTSQKQYNRRPPALHGGNLSAQIEHRGVEVAAVEQRSRVQGSLGEHLFHRLRSITVKVADASMDMLTPPCSRTRAARWPEPAGSVNQLAAALYSFLRCSSSAMPRCGSNALTKSLIPEIASTLGSCSTGSSPCCVLRLQNEGHYKASNSLALCYRNISNKMKID